MTINDRRTETDSHPWGFVVATDSFLSGWGCAPRRSLYALAVSSPQEADVVAANARARTDMRRVRIVGVRPNGLPKTRLSKGDHLSIPSRDEASRWYAPDAWKELA